MRKLLFYLTNNELVAYAWQRGRLSGGRIFNNDWSGREAFSEYLSEEEKLPVQLLVDIVEEDFQRENIPHVVGSARKALISRRLSQLYRDTPYRQASAQGREKDGRKDDRILFSAITNPDIIKPWMDVIEQKKLPLAGIYSAALLSSFVFKKLGLISAPTLLVTHQSGGLRQNYFHEGYLRFSRLNPVFDHSLEAVAQITVAETAKTRQFLASTRLLPRGEPVTIVILAHDDHLTAMQSVCEDTPEVVYRFVDLIEASRLLGIKTSATAPPLYCENLLLLLIGAKAPPRHYTLFEPVRLYQLWQARLTLYGLSAAFAATASIWTASNGIDTYRASEKIRQTSLETMAAETKYQTVVASIEHTETNAHDMKSAVELHQMMQTNGPAPASLMSIVSDAADAVPLIAINQLKWQVSDTDPAIVAAPPAAPVAGAPLLPLSAALIGIPKRPYEILLIEGTIPGTSTDMRTALESVRQFAALLEKNKNMQVEVTRFPVDVNPVVRLEGQAGKDDPTAKPGFSMKVVRKP